ncbi:hypothetical protein JCM11641_001339 [Rhodosporidiobolus odoratus]
MPRQRTTSSHTLAPATGFPAQLENRNEDSEPENRERLPQILWGTKRIPNEGSTARDYLARERNFLSWIKLATTLAIISAALLIRFQFGKAVFMPQWEIDGEIPLGILFFVATLACLGVGTHSFYTSTSGYSQNKAFVYAGKAVDVLVVGIGLLVAVACVLLLAADH